MTPVTTDTILGMPAATYTLIHVLISLVGIASGFVVLFGMIGGKRLDGMTALFLTTTVLTSVTGFCFPNDHITPGIKIGHPVAGGAGDRHPRALRPAPRRRRGGRLTSSPR